MDLLLEATRRAEGRHFWFRGFRRFVEPLLHHAARGRTDLRLLDCGCGTGVNLALLAKHGRAIGVDLTMRGLLFAREDGAWPLARANVVALPFPDAQFDIVTSFDVIYSLDDEDERAAVREMHRVLVPGGRLVLNVAAMPVLRGNHSVLALEKRRYTKRSLTERLAPAGFRIERLTYTNATLFPLTLGVRVAQRALGLAQREEDATSEITVPAAPINALLTAALSMEAQVTRYVSLPFGSSLLCLATKV